MTNLEWEIARGLTLVREVGEEPTPKIDGHFRNEVIEECIRELCWYAARGRPIMEGIEALQKLKVSE